MTNPTTPDVVIGEMRPWSDRHEGSFLAGGPVLAELLDGVRDAGRVLVLGPTQDEIIGALAEQAASVNVLVRSTTDAETVRQALGASADVVVGGLEAFTPEAGGRYDTIVAVDGLAASAKFVRLYLPVRRAESHRPVGHEARGPARRPGRISPGRHERPRHAAF